MKKIIMFYTILAVVMCSIQGLAASKNSPYYMQFIPAEYDIIINKHIIVYVGNPEIEIKGICLSISDKIITIKSYDGIHGIPISRIIRFWIPKGQVK